MSREKRPMGSSKHEMLPPRWPTSDHDQSPDVECTGAEPSTQPLGTPHTVACSSGTLQRVNQPSSFPVTLASICSTMPHINATPAPPAWSPSMVVLTTKVAPTREGELMWSYPLYIKPCMDRQPLYTDGRCLQLRR